MSGSKTRDDEQLYHLGQAQVFPDGSAMEFYSTPDNRRMVFKHSSGSHLEFKADGSVFIKAMKDLQIHGGSVNKEVQKSDGNISGAEIMGLRQDTDMAFDITGKFKIKCDSFEVETKNVCYVHAGTDLKMESNNCIQKAKEGISLEATKTIYMDSKEKSERFVRTRSELGTSEGSGGLSAGKPMGGLNVINVHGNTVIENTDIKGGITISSAGYLNLVCGQERIDITGKWGPAISGFLPSTVGAVGMATHTSMVFRPTPPGPLNIAKPGGTFTQITEGGSVYNDAVVGPTHQKSPGFGYTHNVLLGNFLQNVKVGNRIRNVLAGNESVLIGGIQSVKASMIFLN
jgi:hypothetical protein